MSFNSFEDFGDISNDLSSIVSGLGKTTDNDGDAKLHYGKQDFLKASFREAFNNFEDAADLGCARAYYFLGLMYAEGLGVTEDYDKAKEYWTKGKENIDELCTISLMDAEEFDEIYEDEDSEEAQRALENRETDSFFGFQLAKMCSEYDSDLLDVVQIKDSLEKSASEGNALAMYELYKVYVEDRDFKKANETLQRSAELKYPKAMIKMGELFENGADNYPIDINQALSWYNMAKDANSKQANLHLGMLYYRCEEYKSAFAYMKRSAKAGYPEAMYKLGLMYLNGWGAKVKTDEAAKWFTEAAKQGYNEAKKYLEEQTSKKDDMPPVANVKTDNEETNTVIVKYIDFIESLRSSGVSQRETAKKVVEKIIGNTNIDCCMFCPHIDPKAIAAANNNYAGRNLPFDVLAILDDAPVPKFYGKSGIMLTSKKLISSQGFAVLLEKINKVSVRGKILDIFCEDGVNLQHNLRKPFGNEIAIDSLIFALIHTAKIYRS